ncbi:baseplate assembly protein [Alphaproteobacteria bacterium]|nr:baseplate assembly protein [Alphaproteobacteria bacterium]
MQSSFAFSDLFRRVANLIRIGKISEIDGSQVKVEIGKVKTNWLPIVSTAGDTSCWIPISVGEQVVVLSPFGEISQSVVLRSIHYDKYNAPENENDISFNAKADVKANSDKKFEASFENGIELKTNDTYIYVHDGNVQLKSGNASITIDNNQIEISSGNSGITLSSSGIQLSCGASSIDMSNSNISLTSTSLSSSPPFCKCTGGM